MKILKSVTFCLMLVALSAFAFACNAPSSQSIESTPNVESTESAGALVDASTLVTITEDTVIITASADYADITSKTVLVDYMSKLKSDNVLDFTIKDGMVNSINGLENPADWSKCWMLYTNDTELSNEAWGKITVNDVVYLSAILGAESLPIKDGMTYVWVYASF